jgi:hypothetical protein
MSYRFVDSKTVIGLNALLIRSVAFMDISTRT